MNGPDVALTYKLNRYKISDGRKGAIFFLTIEPFFQSKTILYHDCNEESADCTHFFYHEAKKASIFGC